MNRQSKQLIEAVSQAAGVPIERIQAGLALMEGRVVSGAMALPLLVNQATAARLLSVSRFTVRRLVADGSLRPISIRGAVRYSREEIERMIRSANATSAGLQPTNR